MIYFIQSGVNGPIKIGFTDNGIEQRIASLQTASPHKLKLLALMEGTVETERLLHSLFHNFHLNGEWYSANTSLLEFINSNATAELSKFLLERYTKKVIGNWKKRLIGKDRIHLTSALKDIERELIIEALKIHNCSQVKTAHFLGISNSALCNKVKHYGIDITQLKSVQ